MFLFLLLSTLLLLVVFRMIRTRRWGRVRVRVRVFRMIRTDRRWGTFDLQTVADQSSEHETLPFPAFSPSGVARLRQPVGQERHVLTEHEGQDVTPGREGG